MVKLNMTEQLARVAGADAANRQMRAAGRTVWNELDYNLAVATFNKLWPDPHAGERFRLVNREDGQKDQTPPRFFPAKMKYAIQCKDTGSGLVGDFGFDTEQADHDGDPHAITPIFANLADFFRWVRANNIQLNHGSNPFQMQEDSMSGGTLKTVADYLIYGSKQTTIKEMKKAVNVLGYTFDRHFDARGKSTCLTGEFSGVQHNHCTLNLIQIDNGISPFHYKDARRDENFEKLQKMRRDVTLFAVRNNCIYTF